MGTTLFSARAGKASSTPATRNHRTMSPLFLGGRKHGWQREARSVIQITGVVYTAAVLARRDTPSAMWAMADARPRPRHTPHQACIPARSITGPPRIGAAVMASDWQKPHAP